MLTGVLVWLGIVGFDRALLCAPGTPAAARLLAGGYAELERELRSAVTAGELPGVSPDAFDEAVASAARESESAIVHYDKSGHSAHVVLGKGWHLEKECVEATAKATVEIDYALGNGAERATVWVVGGGGGAAPTAAAVTTTTQVCNRSFGSNLK